VGADPVTLRSTAGRLASPIGEVMGTASEHDGVAGTERCAHTLFVFNLAGRRVAHLGDLWQRALRDDQLAALGVVDLLFAPVGGSATIGAALGASFIVPTH
jgi:L-ascorbate metabolism protein UlaG (beta-lactamase superfamily)